MHIAAIRQHGVAGWPTVKWGPLSAGLNVLYGPPRSGKTTLANLVAETLFGKSSASTTGTAQNESPPGDVFVESDQLRFRVRRYRDEQGTSRLTVAGFDGSVVDAGTMRRLVRGISPTVLSSLCAVSFRESPDINRLLTAEFARAYQAIESGKFETSNPSTNSRRTAELAARRDQLAQDLETRLAGERQVSKELEARCRELDRLIRAEQELVAKAEQSLQATETALAETDARLRYRRLELNVGRQGAVSGSGAGAVSPDDVSEQVARVRAMLAELAQREAIVRAELSYVQVSQPTGGVAAVESQAWLAVGRQLAADLAGEVARLARASASQQCVCRDAHPRLRPISETIERQLDVLAKLLDEQRRSNESVERQTEVDYLAQSQAALRRQLDQLLQRAASRTATVAATNCVAVAGPSTFSAADAEQLESRRLELEQQRFKLVDDLRAHSRAMRDFRAQRETVERQRAALLSARSIEHVQRELTGVQQKLEQVTSAQGDSSGSVVIADDNPARASDYLAQLTDGELVQVTLVEQGRRACVVNRAGQMLRVESLPAAQRDLVYLSLCLALLSAARRQGIRLPLVLDEPFERLDTRGTAALSAVLDDFSRQGHQVVVFTGQQAAAERLASLGAAAHDILSLRQREHRPASATAGSSSPASASTRHSVAGKNKRTRRKVAGGKRRKARPANTESDHTSTNDQSDAA